LADQLSEKSLQLPQKPVFLVVETDIVYCCGNFVVAGRNRDLVVDLGQVELDRRPVHAYGITRERVGEV
jgi:hypothetical protein